jgi:hypothetical protein
MRLANDLMEFKRVYLIPDVLKIETKLIPMEQESRRNDECDPAKVL